MSDPTGSSALSNALERAKRLHDELRAATETVASTLNHLDDVKRLEAELRAVVMEIGTLTLTDALGNPSVSVERPAPAAPSESDPRPEPKKRRTSIHTVVVPNRRGTSPSLSNEAIERLQKKMVPKMVQATPEPTRPSPPSRDASEDLEALRGHRQRLGGVPSRLVDYNATRSEIFQLARHASQGDLALLGNRDRRVNRSVCQWITSRLRAAQERWYETKPGKDRDTEETMNDLFRRLSRHSKVTWPGTIHGLAREHGPLTESWAGDAARDQARIDVLIDELAEEVRNSGIDMRDTLDTFVDEVHGGLDDDVLVARVGELVRKGVRPDHPKIVGAVHHRADLFDSRDELGPLRTAIQKADTNGHGNGELSSLPEDWPVWEHVRNKKAIIYGGVERPEKRASLQEMFEFAELGWIDGADGGLRAQNALLERMRNGDVDIVIVLQPFCSHSMTEAVFKLQRSQATPVLSEGYGPSQLRLALERYLQPSTHGAEEAASTG